MTASILHRLAGLFLYLGLLLLAGWALSLAEGKAVFAGYSGLMSSWPGLALWFLITLSGFFHLANGIRHLVWDVGFGFKPKTADVTALIALGFAIVASVGFWLRLSAFGVFDRG